MGAGSMYIEVINHELSVCKIRSLMSMEIDSDFFFLSVTDKELSLVCKTEEVPADCIEREDGWKAFRIAGVLDFSLVGILSGITGALAEKGIAVFAVSTYDTDYILVKKESLDEALAALTLAAYGVSK